MCVHHPKPPSTYTPIPEVVPVRHECHVSSHELGLVSIYVLIYIFLNTVPQSPHHLLLHSPKSLFFVCGSFCCSHIGSSLSSINSIYMLMSAILVFSFWPLLCIIKPVYTPPLRPVPCILFVADNIPCICCHNFLIHSPADERSASCPSYCKRSLMSI